LTSIHNPLFPLILPGLITATSVQSAEPADRLFFTYTHLPSFQVFNSNFARIQGVDTTVNTRSNGFNLSVLNTGFEKTLWCGCSVYVMVPDLNASENVTGQQITGVGDISGGIKFVIWCDPAEGAMLTAGTTVTAPTGRPGQFATRFDLVTPFNTTFSALPAPTGTTSMNPTFIQPWLACSWSCEHVMVQDYVGVIVPTSEQLPTFVNNDFTIAFPMYRSHCVGLATSLTPTLDIQALVPVNHIGTPAANLVPAEDSPGSLNLPPPTFGFSSQVFVIPGVTIGVCENILFTVAYIIPVAGPRSYHAGATVGFTMVP
jgi:hypothetical protein